MDNNIKDIISNDIEVVSEEWALSHIPFSKVSKEFIEKSNCLDTLMEYQVTPEEAQNKDYECGIHVYWDKSGDYKMGGGLYIHGAGDFINVDMKQLLGENLYDELLEYGYNMLEEVN